MAKLNRIAILPTSDVAIISYAHPVVQRGRHSVVDINIECPGREQIKTRAQMLHPFGMSAYRRFKVQ